MSEPTTTPAEHVSTDVTVDVEQREMSCMVEAHQADTGGDSVVKATLTDSLPYGVQWPPVRWREDIPVARAGGWLGAPVLVCPECGEPAAFCNPRVWTVVMGPFPQWAHQSDGEPPCPVMGLGGYVPAPRPVPLHLFGQEVDAP